MASAFDDDNPTAAAAPATPQQKATTGDVYVYDGMLLAASVGGGEAVVAKDMDDGSVLGLSGQSFVDGDGRHVVHFLDVQGELEAFLLVVVVRREDSRIVSVMKF